MEKRKFVNLKKIKIPHSKPYFDRYDKDALLEVLHDEFITNGEKAAELGRLTAGLLDKNWGIATQSGTDALTASLSLLNLKPREKVLVPAYICSAPLDALAFFNLRPEPVDIDRKTLAVCVDSVNEKKKVGTVIAAHLFGIPAPFHKIEKVNLIEDCAQTLGLKSGGKNVGAFGRLSICSFYATKLLATGHGGLLAGNEPELFEKAISLFTHDKREEWFPHLHFLMSDLNAALGISQIKKLHDLIRKRKNIAKRYIQALTGSARLADSIYSRFLVIAENPDADKMIKRFQKAGIEAQRPVYKPLYKYLNLDDKKFPNAKWAHDCVISVPIYPGMPETDVEEIEQFLELNKNDLRCWPPA